MQAETDTPFQPTRSAPLLLFGGPYGNLEALLALFEQADRRGIPDRNLLCTGDLAAYCADAQAVVDAIRARDIAVVQGNCEQSLGAGREDCGCGFEAGSVCDLLSAQWYQYAMSELTDDNCAWMRRLPVRIDFTWGGLQWSAIHGGLRQNNRFLFASASDMQFTEELPQTADIVVAGHCGIPFTRAVGRQLWHNPGVIGLPANDGTRRVWFSIAEAAADGITVTHHAMRYDAETASRKMRAQALTGYDQTLLSGLWPSLDVLPAAERRATGTPLELGPVYWSGEHRRRNCA
jgi:predicted phosphodiesterase